MKIVAFSDTHGFHDRVTLPAGDILIFAGDACNRGEYNEFHAFITWLAQFRDQYRHVILVAGNHDWPLMRMRGACVELMEQHKIIYLEDDLVVASGITIYGSPWLPTFCDWAFNLPRGGDRLKAARDAIMKCDVLVTHGASYGTLDRLEYGDRVGCELLAGRMKEIKPKIHIHGDIHYTYGTELTTYGTLVHNVALCDENYDIARPPMVIDIDPMDCMCAEVIK